MSPKRMDTVDPMIRRLQGLAQGSPDLKDAALCYETLLPLLITADLFVEPVSITPEQARAKMERGQPLLDDVDLELDGQAVADLMSRLGRALEAFRQRMRPRTRRWARPPASGRLAQDPPDSALI